MLRGLVKIGDKSVKIMSTADLSSDDRVFTNSDIEMDKRAKAAVKSVIKKAEVCKKPIAGYDTNLKRAFVKYADGSVKYVD